MQFLFYMYSRMCNPTEQVSHTSTSVDGHNTEIWGKRWSDRRNKGGTHVCPVSNNTSFARTLGYTERSYIVPIVTAYCTQYYDCIIKVCYITWKRMDVVR